MLITNESTKQLGQIRLKEPYSFSFPITNIGEQAITITRISVGCGSCTTAAASSSTITAGEATNINVVFTPASTGNQSKNLVVHWDPEKVLRLNFEAISYE